MKKLVFFFLLTIAFISSKVFAQDSSTIQNDKKFKFNIKINAIDLSEDAIGSTENDEDFLLVYLQNGKSEFPIPVLQEFFVLNANKRITDFKIEMDTLLSTDTLTIVLLEQDTQKKMKGIEPTCRLYLNDIVNLYTKKEYTKFTDYFDDDDVLAIWRLKGNEVDLSKPMKKKFDMLNFFDWSKYTIELYK